jgi:hypothetical protein
MCEREEPGLEGEHGGDAGATRLIADRRQRPEYFNSSARLGMGERTTDVD